MSLIAPCPDLLSLHTLRSCLSAEAQSEDQDLRPEARACGDENFRETKSLLLVRQTNRVIGSVTARIGVSNDAPLRFRRAILISQVVAYESVGKSA